MPKYKTTRLKNKGISYDSRLEMQVHDNHPDLVREPGELEYTKVYRPDFSFFTKSGKLIYIEVKGYMNGATRAKMKAVKRDNPDVDIRFLFQKPGNKVGKKMTYATWADRYGFKWAQAPVIPRHWFDE